MLILFKNYTHVIIHVQELFGSQIKVTTEWFELNLLHMK